MPEYFCCVVKCNSGTKKKKNLVKYPWMKNVTFESFPHKTHEKQLRSQWIKMVRRDKEPLKDANRKIITPIKMVKWEPNTNTRICSMHFEGFKGRSEEHPVPTLFPYNNYGGLLSKDTGRKTTRIQTTDAGPSDAIECDQPVPHQQVIDNIRVPKPAKHVTVTTGN